MKKTLFILTIVLAFVTVLNYSANAQEPKKANTTIDSAGNLIPLSSVKINTGKLYIDSKGVKYPVYMTSSKKLFIIAKSAKTGKEYKRYLTLN